MSLVRNWVMTVAAIAVGLFSGGAHALDRATRLTQFHHSAWTVATGAPPDIWAIQQSVDGYLWLGTGAGLYRFDGVRFERFVPTAGDGFLASDIVSMLSLPSGDLWLGYQNGGVSLLRGGRLQTFTQGLPPGPVIQFTQDLDGAIWAVAVDSYSGGGVARFADGRWRRIGTDWGAPDASVRGLVLDREGALWMTGPGVLLRLPRGGRRFEPTHIPVGTRTKLFLGPGDRLWASDGANGTRVLELGGRLTGPPHAGASASEAERIIFDRAGALWATSAVGGLFRIAPFAAAAARGPLRAADLTDRFDLGDGLSSNIAIPLLEDREGDIWVGTNLGLDRFRAADIVAQSDIPTTSPLGYRAAYDERGTLYVADSGTVRRIGADGRARVLSKAMRRPMALCPSRDGSLWLASEHTLWKTGTDRLEAEPVPPEITRSTILSCQQDRTGVLWVSVLGEGVFRRGPRGWSRLVFPGQPPRLGPHLMIADRRGGMWLYYLGRSLLLVNGVQVHSFGPAEGLDVGSVDIVYPIAQGVLVGGDQGVARYDGRRFRSLKATQAEPFRRITGIVQTDRGETWMNGIAGVLKMRTADLEAAFDGPGRDGSGRALPLTILTFQDGLPGLAQQDSYTPTAFAGPDGRVWFITNHGLAWTDPASLTRNPLPPPVVIRSLRANGRPVSLAGTVVLDRGVSSLQIDYTALSLAIPERVRFKYRLEGVDAGWVDPGDRRQAFYTKLGPGRYSFKVIAANNDGVWNTTGAALVIRIPPTFVQTKAFMAFVLLLAAAALWLLYSIRLRQISARIRVRLGERLGERERIARELHDTLLQGFQGLMLRFQVVAARIPPEHPAHRMMEEALDEADIVLVEGRDSVRDLRGPGAFGDLSKEFAAAAARAAGGSSAKFRVVVEGRPISLHPIVATEIVRVGCEAIANAFRHAQASRIDVDVAFQRKAFSMRIVDDGVGIDAAILAAGRRGHFGLTGMRERASFIRGQFSVASRPGAGTEVTLTVPSRYAYATPRARRWLASPALMEGV